MFNKRALLLLFLLLIAIGTVSSVCATDLTDDIASDSSQDKIEVNENDNIIEEDTSSDLNVLSSNESDVLKMDVDGKSLTKLQDLINNANEGSTISLDSDYYAEDDFDSLGVVIDKTLTINGNGHTFYLFENTRAFTVYADDVVINDLTFIDADGSCLYLFNNFTTINNCNFINNTGQSGAAIAAAGELEVNNCYFYNNHATNHGGAIYALYPLHSLYSVSVSNCIFDWNWAEGYGGAICLYYITANDPETGNPHFYGTAAKSFIKNSTFIDNEASWGGALFNLQYTDIEDCQFRGNFVGGGGGAIYMYSGEFFDYSSGYTYQEFGLEIHGNTSFIDNCADRYGGAITISSKADIAEYGVKGILNVYDNVLFQENYAGEYGGALSIGDGVECAVIGARFVDNEAEEEGSAMYGGTAINCIFEGDSGSAIYGTEVIENYDANLTLKQSGSYYGDKKITVTLTDSLTNKGIANKEVVVKFSNGKSLTLKTNSNGVGTANVPYAPGTYTATATVKDTNINVTSKLSNIEIVKAPIAITPTKLSTTYASGKYFQVKVVNSKTKKVVNGLELKLKVYTGNKYKTVTVKTNSKGIANYAASTLAVGTHKVIVSNGNAAYATGSQKTSSIKISKASYNIIAPKVTNALKQGSFKITVKNKASNKAVSGVKLTVKVYTGSKYKTYSLKTNGKGVATLSTKSLSKGNHKIVVTTKATSNYNAATKSSSAQIVSKIPTIIGYVPGLIFHATNDGYHSHTYSATIQVTLTDNNGNALTKPVTLKHSDGYTASGMSGESITVSGGRPGTVTLIFAGDSKYAPSSYVVNLGNEPF